MPALAAVVIMHGSDVLRRLVRRLIDDRIEATVVAEAGDFTDALNLVEQLANGKLQAKVAILGLKLAPSDIEGSTGGQVYSLIREKAPGVKIAVFSPIPFSPQPGDVYVSHTCSRDLDRLIEAVRTLLNGQLKKKAAGIT